MSNIQSYLEEGGITVDVFKESRVTVQSDLGDRFDCNYRNPEYFKIIKELEDSCIKHDWELKKIGEIKGIRVKEGSTPKGQESFTLLPGIPFIKTKNVYKGYLKIHNLNFLTNEAHKQKSTNAVKNGDILITIIGANFDVIGRVYVYNNQDLCEIDSEDANINQNIAKLTNIPDSYDEIFVENFLNSHLGQVQIRRFSKQAVQVNLSAEEIKLVKIPKPPKPLQNKMSSIILRGRKTSKNFAQDCDFQVKQIDEKLLEASNVKISNTTIRSFKSDILDQFNVNFYHPKYVKFFNSLKEQEKCGNITIKKLGEISTRIKRPCNFDEDLIYKYVELGDIDSRTGKISSYDSISGGNTPSRAKWEIKENDLLIPTLKGSSKNIAIVDKEFDGSIASSGFVIFSSQNADMRYYLFAILRSPIVQMQYEKLATGSIMSDVSSDIIEEFLIPIPKNDTVLERTINLIKESMTHVTKFYTEADVIIQQTEFIFNEVLLGRITIEQGEKRANSFLTS